MNVPGNQPGQPHRFGMSEMPTMTRSNCTALALSAAMFAYAAPFAVQSAHALPEAVTAQSDYGNGSVTGAVRLNSRGYPEVQLPSGTWIDCEGDCREAMRRIYLDFWEILQEESGGDDKQ